VILFPPAIQTPAPESPLPFASLKAQYKWSFRGAKDSGSGTLALRLEPGGGKLVLEVFAYGDRLALVDGDSAGGYQFVLPKENVNRTVPTLAELPLPFLPQAGSVEALARALANGEGDGLPVEKRDDKGPVKLRYTGHDSAGNPLEVQLTRKRWEPAK
jgi:hypothetical protein